MNQPLGTDRDLDLERAMGTSLDMGLGLELGGEVGMEMVMWVTL